MLTDKHVIKRLWHYGHFRNPGYPDVYNVEQDDLDKLTVTDSSVQQAIRSYQEFFGDRLNELTLQYHGRALSTADGDVGPATRELLAEPRCGVPEFGNAEEANWPTACRGKLKAGYDMRLGGLSADTLKALWLEMMRNWNGALTDVDISIADNQSAADIWADGRPLPGSTLAWSYLAQNRCDVRLQQAYDTTITWSEVLFVTTATHEVGHALGLNHVNDSSATMYPSINSAARSRRGFPNRTDLNQCRRIGYSVAANPQPEPDEPDDPDDPPGPGPNPGQIQIIGGDLTVKVAGRDPIYLRVIESISGPGS